MKKRILVLGGYGSFGAHIVQKLSVADDLQVIIAGRSEKKAQALGVNLAACPNPPEVFVVDVAVQSQLTQALATLRPDIVIHTCGPFQGQSYQVARACIAAGCHYIDLADGREFVTGITALQKEAQEKGVSIISGASSVPCLTAAVIDHYLPNFSKLTGVDYGITTAQRTNTGLATTAAVLGYVGKPFKTLIDGRMQTVYGWQGLTLRHYPTLGKRFLGYCDVPDLSLFPARYKDLKNLQFRAGAEIKLLHLGLWALSGLVRMGLIQNLSRRAPQFLKASRWFDFLGSNKSGFHMQMMGLDAAGHKKTHCFYLIARNGHGPFIPSTPAILCAQKLARGTLEKRGAFPCLDIISLPEYLEALVGLDITPLYVQ